MIRTGNKVARLAELGTVIGSVSVGDPPDGFEGDWPREGSGRMAVIYWPGRKKLAVEPMDSLIVPDSGF